MGIEEITYLAAVDSDKLYVEKIVNHEEMGSNPNKWKYRTRWQGYEPEDEAWLDWL